MEHHYYFIGSIIFCMGLVLIFYNLYLLRRGKHHLNLDILVHGMEAIILSLISYLYYKQGKIYLPYITSFAGLVYLFSILLLIKKHHRKRAKESIS